MKTQPAIHCWSQMEWLFAKSAEEGSFDYTVC
uniref:Uncharacterized protein n=1 Tax=Anguilla anguilla TaxID=7936 RepID=A0A0E9PYW3_ANGAN